MDYNQTNNHRKNNLHSYAHEDKNILIPERNISRTITGFYCQLIIVNLRLNRIQKNDLLDGSFFENTEIVKNKEKEILDLLTNYQNSLKGKTIKGITDVHAFSTDVNSCLDELENLVKKPTDDAQENYESIIQEELIQPTKNKKDDTQKTVNELETFLENLRSLFAELTTQLKKTKDSDKENNKEEIVELKEKIEVLESTASENNQWIISKNLLLGTTSDTSGSNPQKNLQAELTNSQKNKYKYYLNQLKKISTVQFIINRYENLINELIKNIALLIASHQQIEEFFAKEEKGLIELKTIQISTDDGLIESTLATSKSFFDKLANYTLYFMMHINQEIPEDKSETDLLLLDDAIFSKIFIKK